MELYSGLDLHSTNTYIGILDTDFKRVFKKRVYNSLDHILETLQAQRDASKRGRRRPETIYFLGVVLYCTRNQKGNFKVGMRTEKSRLHRSLSHLRDLMRRCLHLPVREQAININRVLRGHYAYYGIAGNFRALPRVHRATERYWRKMLSSRSHKGHITWEVFHRIKERYPLQRPKLYLTYRQLQAIAVL
jgi:hypothetical protein